MATSSGHRVHFRVNGEILALLEKRAKALGESHSQVARNALISALTEPDRVLSSAERGIATLRELVVEMRDSLNEKADLITALSAASVGAASFLRDDEEDTVEIAQQKIDGHIQQSLLAYKEILRIHSDLERQAKAEAATRQKGK